MGRTEQKTESTVCDVIEILTKPQKKKKTPKHMVCFCFVSEEKPERLHFIWSHCCVGETTGVLRTSGLRFGFFYPLTVHR